MSTHNADITTAFGTTSGTFSGETVLTMNFALLKAELQSVGTDLDDLMGRVRFFDTIAAASAATIDTTVGAVIVCGYTTLGDMPPALFDKQGSTPAHDGYFTSNSGTLTWVYIPGPEGISAAPFGFLPSASAAANATAWQKWAAYINQSDYRDAIIPAGSYSVSGGINLTTSRLHIRGYGVSITTSQTSGNIINLNSGALSDESVLESYIVVEGLRLTNSVAYATTANTVVGIKGAGIHRVAIRDVECAQLGVGIELNPRDAVRVENYNGFQNGVHAKIADFQTSGANNPQVITFANCGLSTHYDAGYLFQGNVNNIRIVGGYNVGSRAIVCENASSESDNNGLILRDHKFDQGADVTLTGTWTFTSSSTAVTAPGADGAATTELTAGDLVRTAAGNVYVVASVTDDDNIVLNENATATENNVATYRAEPYIDILDTNSGELRNVIVTGCKFAAFNSVGGSTLAHIMHCRSVLGLTIGDMQVGNRAPGWLYFDSTCVNIDIGRIEEAGTDNLVKFDCGREQIRCWPYVVDFPTYTGGNGNLLVNGTALSDSATIDMSATISATYWPKYIPPRGYEIAITARDSGSSAASAGAVYLAALPSSSITAGERYRYVNAEIAGLGNDFYSSTVVGYVPADDNGDIYLLLLETGTDTCDSYVVCKRMFL